MLTIRPQRHRAAHVAPPAAQGTSCRNRDQIRIGRVELRQPRKLAATVPAHWETGHRRRVTRLRRIAAPATTVATRKPRNRSSREACRDPSTRPRTGTDRSPAASVRLCLPRPGGEVDRAKAQVLQATAQHRGPDLTPGSAIRRLAHGLQLSRCPCGRLPSAIRQPPTAISHPQRAIRHAPLHMCEARRVGSSMCAKTCPGDAWTEPLLS